MLFTHLKNPVTTVFNPTYFCNSVENLSSPEVLEKLEEGQLDSNITSQIESACVLLSYLGDALHAIGSAQPHSKSLNICYIKYIYII